MHRNFGVCIYFGSIVNNRPIIYEACLEKKLHIAYADIEHPDLPAYPRSLIRTFVVCLVAH